MITQNLSGMVRLIKPYNQRLGSIGEQSAVGWLSGLGFEILHRNYRNGRIEVDIVAVRNKILYCIEVKTRTSDVFGCPEEFISLLKINQMKMAAERLLYKYGECVEVQLYILSLCMNNNRLEFFFEELE